MDKNKEWFGKEVIITGQVKCNDEDEDLKLYAECCEHVMKMKMYLEQLDKTIKMCIRDRC